MQDLAMHLCAFISPKCLLDEIKDFKSKEGQILNIEPRVYRTIKLGIQVRTMIYDDYKKDAVEEFMKIHYNLVILYQILE